MITPWVGLLLVNAVAVATFARCFTGPGELAVVVPVCIGAQLLAHLGRYVRRNGHLSAAIAIWILTLFLVAYVPLALLDGGSFRFGLLPLSGTWRMLGHQFSDSWAIFSNRVAPVIEAPGLVLAAAWAGGGVALASEALDADTTLPAIVALVPAFDIIVFTGTLGTATGRAPELAAVAALSVWYLSGTRRLSGERVVTARIEGSGTGRPVLPSPVRSGRRNPSAIAGLALVAGVSAGVIGPLLPGATSSALLAWHASGKGSPLNKNGPTGSAIGPISVSSFVDVGEEEITNSNVELFRVFGSSPTREVLFVDDVFTGTQWVQLPSDLRTPVSPFTTSLTDLERHPPAPVVGRNQEQVTQVIANIDLAPDMVLPVPAVPLAMDSDTPATLVGTSGPVVLPPGAFGNNYAYGVQAIVTSSPQVAQEYYNPKAPAAPGVDLALPGTVPARIRDLAESLVSPAMNEEEKATSIQNFLLSHYQYVLPRTVPSTPPGAYAGLEDFLFRTRSGYCQQFASAFGVLARIDGIPTRVVVGFLPTAESHGSWLVTGAETHAWPQVYFPGTGWVDFEPTPGSSTPTYPNITTTTRPGTAAVTTTSIATGVSLPRGSHFAHPVGAGAPSGFSYPTVPPPGGGSTHGSSGGVATVVLALLAGALLWALVVPTWRVLRARRTRDPVRSVLLAWREALAVLAASGIHRRRAETVHEFTRRVRKAGVLSTPADDALDRLAIATDHALFARLPPSAEESRLAAGDSALVRRSARRSMNLWGKILLQLDPRDLLTSP